MGFGNIVSQVVLFMSIMIVIVVLSLVYKTYVSTTNVSLEAQQENVMEKMDTSFNIINGTYDGVGEDVIIFMENTGSLKLNPDLIDIYSDTGRIARDSAARDVDLVLSSNLVNSNHWDPGELIKVNVSQQLTAGSHVFRIGTENGITRTVIIEA